MRDMIKVFREVYNESPREFFLTILTGASIFVFGYLALVLAAILS